MKKMTTNILKTSALALLASGTALASSHREAPLITEDPTVDSTDVYAFRSPDVANTVTLIANYIPFEEPAGPPNYYFFSDSALYEIKVDNTGDAVEDISFQFRFRNVVRNTGTFLYNTGLLNTKDDADRNVTHRYTLTQVNKTAGRETSRTVLVADGEVAGPRIGPRSNGDKAAYEAYANLFVTNIGAGATAGKTFVGPRDEGFYVDVNAIFDLLNVSRADGLGTGDGDDGTAGFNVHSLAIQLPITALTRAGVTPGAFGTAQGGPDAVLGVWTTASRPKHRVFRKSSNPRNTGPFVQVSRLGLPLINEVVNPLAFKDQFNRTEPKDDLSNIAGFVVDPELSRLLTAVHSVPTPPAPRTDLVAVISFLPGLLTSRTDLQPADVLRLNVAIGPTSADLNAPVSRLGVIGTDVGGFPNGRRPGDDVADILERVVGAGILSDANCPNCTNAAGAPTTDFGDAFPGNALNDGIEVNDVAYLNVFPYLGTPHEGFVHAHAH